MSADRSQYQKRYREAHKEERRAYYEAHKEELRESRKRHNEAHKEEHREYNKKYYLEHREALLEKSKQYSKDRKEERKCYQEGRAEKVQAVHALNSALRTDKWERRGVVRSGVCSRCGDSSGGIEGHHEDYSKPFNVTWLCRSCHTAWHVLQRKGIMGMQGLDEWITGHYGEDQFKGTYFCLKCGECVDELVAEGGPETELLCEKCREESVDG